ncbi:hypothetical protein ACFWVU_31225 [Streptomyces sp. NPDC058686]|uniref:hypothetical protein n=1 Tax=Streptomyces sp. NPDC058686 TaxID=3346599 RepID=UPI003653824C
MPETSRFWITSLRQELPETIRRLARRTALTDATVRHLKEDLSLLDVEGRSFLGWYYHVALVQPFSSIAVSGSCRALARRG